METSNKASPWLTVNLNTWGSLVKPEYLVSYPANTIITRQGQVCQSVYIVKTGRVMMRSLVQDGRETVMMFAESGGLFGEEGIFEKVPQPYSAVTIVNCKIYRIPLNRFFNVLTSSHEVNLAVMTVLSRKVNFYCSQILELSFGDVRYRVAGVFLYLISMYGRPKGDSILIDLPFTHQDVADFIKSSRVSVNKVFNEFVEHGIIHKEKQRYIVLSIRHLECIVNTV